MFSLFKKSGEIEKLKKQHQKLLGEVHRLSTIDRKASDQKMAEAEAIMDRIVSLQKQSS